MAAENQFPSDIEAILSHRHDNGADYWATPDMRLIKGAPWSTLECASFLLELGMEPSDLILQKTADLIFSTWQKDGRFRLYPKGAIYPCQTIFAARALCQLGYADDERIRKTIEHLLDIQQLDGGWRCKKFSFGRGPETESSNPYPTLLALDLFRLVNDPEVNPKLERAVDFLLEHWTIRAPIGPCHYGIGTLFMQVEYPFRTYNLFQYIHVLSFYSQARSDKRFLEAFASLQSKTVNEQIVVERVVPKLAGLAFCKKGQPSLLATKRYQEILGNLERA